MSQESIFDAEMKRFANLGKSPKPFRAIACIITRCRGSQSAIERQLGEVFDELEEDLTKGRPYDSEKLLLVNMLLGEYANVAKKLFVKKKERAKDGTTTRKPSDSTIGRKNRRKEFRGRYRKILKREESSQDEPEN